MVNTSSAAPPTVTYVYPAGVQRGTTAEVTASGSFDKWPVKVWASGTGVAVEPGKDKGKLSVKVAADAVPGVYWVRAYNDDGASPLRPFVVGLLPELTEKEPNDEPTKPQVVDGPAVVNGVLSKSGDVDCFAIAVKKGQTLVASLDASATLKSPMDGILQIVSAGGFVVAQNNDFRGLDPQVTFTAPNDGTYVARVFAFPATPDSSIRFSGADTYVYRLTLTTGGFVDYAMPLAVGPDTKAVEAHGWNLPAAVSLAAPARSPGDTHLILFDPKFANPLRLRAEPHPVVVRRGPGSPLVPPVSVSARIEKPGAAVEVDVRGKKGQALTLQAESRSLGLAVNPVVAVFDKGEKQLARAEPGKLSSDTTLSFTPPADGEYRVRVTDLFDGGGPRHAFLLRVLTPEPDYDLSVAGDRFAIPPGKPLDVPIKIARRNGFAKPVEVVAEGLPEGVKWEVKPPAGKADPNTVTVTLSGEKAGVGGAFRLVGRVKGEPAFTRTATAPLAGFDESTAGLWATVTTSAVVQPPAKKKRN